MVRKRRTPQGVRGLKSMACRELQHDLSRTPQGVRGLKSENAGRDQKAGQSHPARGAWIEILLGGLSAGADGVAPRKGCVD